MAEEQIKETQEAAQADVSAADELAAVTAQLDEERKAKAALEEAVTAKDARIAEIEAALSEERQTSEARGEEARALETDVKALMQVRDDTISQYLSMAKALNPSIPEGIIAGATIEDINESINRGKAIVEAVKKTMEAEAAGTKVPAGAPARSAISTESMSPREKIAYAIQPKQ